MSWQPCNDPLPGDRRACELPVIAGQNVESDVLCRCVLKALAEYPPAGLERDSDRRTMGGGVNALEIEGLDIGQRKIIALGPIPPGIIWPEERDCVRRTMGVAVNAVDVGKDKMWL